MPGPQARPHTPKVLCPLQLLSAASLFQLDALQRHCEILCSQTLSVESAVNTYKYAKVRTCTPSAHPGAPEVTAAPWGHMQRGAQVRSSPRGLGFLLNLVSVIFPISANSMTTCSDSGVTFDFFKEELPQLGPLPPLFPPLPLQPLCWPRLCHSSP